MLIPGHSELGFVVHKVAPEGFNFKYFCFFCSLTPMPQTHSFITDAL
jgi:hypothetical protein